METVTRIFYGNNTLSMIRLKTGVKEQNKNIKTANFSIEANSIM